MPSIRRRGSFLGVWVGGRPRGGPVGGGGGGGGGRGEGGWGGGGGCGAEVNVRSIEKRYSNSTVRSDLLFKVYPLIYNTADTHHLKLTKLSFKCFCVTENVI